MRNYLFLLLLFTCNALAVTEYDRTIASIGIGANINTLSSANLRIAEKPGTDCLYGVLYFDVTSEIGKAMYSTLLMAKAGKLKLSRIDYFQSVPAGACTLTYVEIAN